MPARSFEDLFPYQSHTLEVDGLKLAYIDEGPRDARDAVILLHGNPTWSFYYRELIALLAPHVRVIAPDHIGCGRSDHPTDRHFKAADRVAHLEKLIEHLGLTSFSLVVHDWGGPIGSGLAVRHVDMVKRLVYLNTTLTETESLPGIIKKAASWLTGPFITKYTMRFLKLMTGFGVVKRLPQEVVDGYYAPYQTVARRTAIWDFVQDIPFDSAHPTHAELVDLGSRLPNLRDKPVLIYWGLRDPCFHRGMLTQVSSHFPQARVVELANASHLVLEDMSAEAKADIVSFLTGAEVRAPVADSTGLGLYGSFMKVAKEAPSADAVVTPRVRERLGNEREISYHRLSFAELAARVWQYERGLQDLGLRKGDKVLMLVPPGPEFLALAYSVMGRGAIPVFVDPGMGVDNLARCIAEAAPDAMIGGPKAQLLRLLKRRSFRSIRFQLLAVDAPIPGVPTLSFFRRFARQPIEPVPPQSSDTVLIAFTSGATGTPKGVVFTAAMLEAQLTIFRDVFGVRPGTLDTPLLPIFSLFSLGCGVGSVFAPIDPSHPLSLKPGVILQILQETKAASSFGSPALWEKLCDYGVRYGIRIESLQKIFMAGAPVPLQLLRQLPQIAPAAEISTPYGATEALPVTWVTGTDLLALTPVPANGGEQGTPVGRCVSGIELMIARPRTERPQMREDFDALPPREIGEVLVRGANVSPRYLARPDANAGSKMHDGETFWHRIGDVGYLDEQGNLYYCGRAAHVVSVRGTSYYSDPVERVMNEHPKVKRSALVSIRGTEVGLVIEAQPDAVPGNPVQEHALTSELIEWAEKHPATQGIRLFFYRGNFPVDPRHNAKIYRDRLGAWASTLERRPQ